MIEPAILVQRYAGASVLVTGASGFLGTHLCARLSAYGANVAGLSRTAPDAGVLSGINYIHGDVRDDAAVARLIGGKPQYVFNLAAYSGQVPSFTDHEQSLTTNCLGLINVLDAIRTHSPSTRLIFASSRLVYGRTRYLPVDEGHPREALSLYGIHKRTCEEYCEYYGARWGIETVVLRLANPYGPHRPAGHTRYNIANWMIDELVEGREIAIYGRGEQLRDYIYVDDAVDAILAAAVEPHAGGRTYNVGSGEGTPLVDFAQNVIDAAARGSYAFVEWPAESLQVETGDYAADISRITDEIGWQPRVSLAAGIAATVAAQQAARDAALVRERRAA